MLGLRKLNFKRAAELIKDCVQVTSVVPSQSKYRLGVLFFSCVCSDWQRQWSPTD